MKLILNRYVFVLCLVFLSPVSTRGQDSTGVEKLKQQLQQLQENFEKAQREQRQQLDTLQRQLDQLQSRPSAAPVAAASATETPPAVAAPWSLTDPIRVGKSGAYADLGASVTMAAGGSTEQNIAGNLELGHHDPSQQGFTLQGVEISLTGAVDPYFRGSIALSYGLSSENEGSLELEEAWAETVSLPWGLKVRAGQEFTEFGRFNPTHLHAWSFVDTPLVNGRFMGEDQLRNPGLWASWLMPVNFYSEFYAGIQDSEGETAANFRGGEDAMSGEEMPGMPFSYRPNDNDRGVQHVQDMLMWARYAASFELTDNQTLLAGLSGAFGPNSRGDATAGETRTGVTGVDLTWKWRSPSQHGGFPFVAWQTEGMVRFYEAGAFDWDLNGDGASDAGEVVDPVTGLPAVLAGENLTDYGFYSQISYGFAKGWVAGLRYDWVSSIEADYEKQGLTFDGGTLGRDPARAPRWRISPNLTWYPSEFSKIRLQVNYDQRTAYPDAYSVWLQFEFLLGAHAAHKF